MSCRHDLANGTCMRCYPGKGLKDPGPEEDYEPNLEGPGAITREEHLRAADPATIAGCLLKTPIVADISDNLTDFERDSLINYVEMAKRLADAILAWQKDTHK